MRLKSGIRSDSEEGQEGSDQDVVLSDGVWTVAIVSSAAGWGEWIASPVDTASYTSSNTTLRNICGSNVFVATSLECSTSFVCCSASRRSGWCAAVAW